MDAICDVRDVVVSTRVRLARNLSGINFPPKMSPDDFQRMNQRIVNRANVGGSFEVYRMKELSPLQRQSFVEKHQASPQLINNPEGLLLVSKASEIVIMIGEEDHLRIQCLLNGLQLREADNMTRAVDALIEPEGYAFSDTLGYLTSCPTNVGTGMRASAMLHLAGLTATGEIRQIIEWVSKYGFIIRGYYGEGTEAEGDMYQLSNQVTLGVSEDEILLNLSQLANALVQKEREVRRNLFRNEAFVDRLCRGLGLLKYAKRVDDKEMMRLLSNLKLALNGGLVQGTSVEEIDKMIIDLQPAMLSVQLANANVDASLSNEARASELRKRLEKCELV